MKKADRTRGGIKGGEKFRVGVLGSMHVKLDTREVFTRGLRHEVGRGPTGAENARRVEG